MEAFSGCDFSNSDLSNVVLESCKLDHAIFMNTNLTDIKLGLVMNIDNKSQVNSLIFSPNGERILSCSNDNKIKLWDKTSGNLIRIFVGHQNWVKSIAFSPNGQLIISGSLDKTMKL